MDKIKIGENEYDDDYSERFHEEVYTIRTTDIRRLLTLHDKLLDFAESYIKSWRLHAKGPSPQFTKSVVNTQRLANDPDIKAAIAARKGKKLPCKNQK